HRTPTRPRTTVAPARAPDPGEKIRAGQLVVARADRGQEPPGPANDSGGRPPDPASGSRADRAISAFGPRPGALARVNRARTRRGVCLSDAGAPQRDQVLAGTSRPISPSAISAGDLRPGTLALKATLTKGWLDFRSCTEICR